MLVFDTLDRSPVCGGEVRVDTPSAEALSVWRGALPLGSSLR